MFGYNKHMWRILYDLVATQGYKRTQFHGGGEYAKRVFRDIVLNAPSGVTLEAHLQTERFTDPDVVAFAVKHGIQLHYVDDDQALEDLIRAGNFNVYYSALPTQTGAKFSIPQDVTFIYTLHGVRGHLVHDWRLRYRYGKSAPRGVVMTIFYLFLGRLLYKRKIRRVREKIELTSNRKIIGVSNYAKFGYRAALPGVDLSDMIVLDSVPDDAPPERDATILKRAGLTPRSFFLIVSANRYEKNAFRALRAMDRFLTVAEGAAVLTTNYRVAVTGLSRNSRFVRQLRLRNPDRFAFLSYVAPNEIEELYASAAALVYPSLSEGYGYPPVEAMRYNTPSICAGGTSIPEVCGDAAIYFNPYDEDEIIARLWEVCDPDIRGELIPKLRPRSEYLYGKQITALETIRHLIFGTQ